MPAGDSSPRRIELVEQIDRDAFARDENRDEEQRRGDRNDSVAATRIE